MFLRGGVLMEELNAVRCLEPISILTIPTDLRNENFAIVHHFHYSKGSMRDKWSIFVYGKYVGAEGPTLEDAIQKVLEQL